MAEVKAEIVETLHVSLRRSTKELIERMRDEAGVSKVELGGRVFEWFAQLPPQLQLAVLNRNEDTRRRLLKTVVEEMAGGPVDAGDVPATEEQAIRIARRMLARLEQIRAGRANVAQDEASPRKAKR